MQKHKISTEQAQTIAKAVVADAHTYAQNHVTEYIAFLKSKNNNPPTAVYIDEDFGVKGG